MSRFYVTTPIYYVNDVPHLGTSYTTIVADALRRVHVLRGDETRMLTGTDEHGLKIERAATQANKTPIAFVDEVSARFRELWPKLEVQPDDFIRTTEKRHEDLAQWLWREVEKNGDLYLGHYEDWYCVDCEEFKTDKDLLQPGNRCPIHLKPVERLKEETYFFRLAKYEKPLLDLYGSRPGFIEPESRRNEVLSFVKGGLKDLSVSRTSFAWGVPVPGNPKHVMFVWFDALANYWSALQDAPEHQRFWTDARVVHLIGKDIVRFHAVYWPAILMSARLPLPSTVFAHGFLTFNGQKMSKTLRNSVDPLGIARVLFGDVCGDRRERPSLPSFCAPIAFGQDGDFDLPAMVERYNADLGKNLGNLLSRTLGLCTKLTGGAAPALGATTALEDDLAAQVAQHWRDALEHWAALAPAPCCSKIDVQGHRVAGQHVRRLRGAVGPEDKRGNRDRVATILATLLSVLEALSRLGVAGDARQERRAARAAGPVAASARPSGATGSTSAWRPSRTATKLAPAGALFPVIDADRVPAFLAKITPPAAVLVGTTAAVAPTAPEAAPPPPSSAAATISYEQFAAVDLRVGVVRTCERVPKKDKLLRLTVDVGEPEPRTIVAGLAQSFQPEQLVGRRVVVVANLAPRDFGKGLQSQGMLLATGPSDKLSLATVEGDVLPGSKLK